MDRSLEIGDQTLVGVDPLVGDCRDFAGVSQQPGNEVPGDTRQPLGVFGVVERVASAFKERLMNVHSASIDGCNRFGHEGRVAVVTLSDLLYDQFVGHNVIGHRQCIRVAQVDLVLARSNLMMAGLDRDAKFFEHEHSLTSHVGCEVCR